MATKNLARTVIEGGRSRRNKFERRHSNRRERRKASVLFHQLRLDPELADEIDAPPREPIPRSHADRLGAAERWLASFVGRPWSEVRGAIARRFDTRTIAGQHIVFDHLLPSVSGSGCARAWWPSFVIDRAGRLQRAPERPRSSRPRLPYHVRQRCHRELARWARGRRVGKRGRYWYWFEPAGLVETPCGEAWCWRDHVGEGRERRHLEPRGGYRQTRRLTDDEVGRWLRADPELRRELRFELAGEDDRLSAAADTGRTP
jgi:hypothetical protein